MSETVKHTPQHWATKGPLFEIDTDRAGKKTCGECYIKPGETCDICGASNPAPAEVMAPDRAIYFLERFKREEKMLGPHEQEAIDIAIAALTKGQKNPSEREQS